MLWLNSFPLVVNFELIERLLASFLVLVSSILFHCLCSLILHWARNTFAQEKVEAWEPETFSTGPLLWVRKLSRFLPSAWRSSTVTAATREDTSTDLTVIEAKMCSRQAVSKRLLRSYTAAFLDGISWSATISSCPKNELESGSPPPKCGPKNGTVFGALNTCHYENLTSKLQKRVSIPVPFLVPLFQLFWFAVHCFFCAQNKRKTSKT